MPCRGPAAPLYGPISIVLRKHTAFAYPAKTKLFADGLGPKRSAEASCLGPVGDSRPRREGALEADRDYTPTGDGINDTLANVQRDPPQTRLLRPSFRPRLDALETR